MCRMCGSTLPADADHYPRNRTHPDGLGERCHACNRSIVRGWVDNNRSKVNRRQKRRYWERRAAGERRVTVMVNGKPVVKWAKKPGQTAAAPASTESFEEVA